MKLKSESEVFLETEELGNIKMIESTLNASVLKPFGPYRKSKGPMGVGTYELSVAERINDVMRENSIARKLTFFPIPKLIVAAEVVLCSGDHCLLTGKWGDETKTFLIPVRGYPFLQWQSTDGTEYLDQSRELAHAGYGLAIIAMVAITTLLLMHFLN